MIPTGQAKDHVSVEILLHFACFRVITFVKTATESVPPAIATVALAVKASF